MGHEGPDVQGLLQELVERQRLLEKLSRIQASISHRQPLQDVLDAITQGATDLLGDEVVGLRLADPNDPDYVVIVSSVGLDEGSVKEIERTPVRQGAGGTAMLEARLVVIEDYHRSSEGLDYFRERELQAAMAAPVRERGHAIGSLVVATYKQGRTYSDSEKEALMSLADHASLALADAKTVEAMREAQRDKDMFLAMASHELKTPLTVIMGALQALERYAETIDVDKARDLIGSARERGRELARMIDLLLQGASAEVVGDVRPISLKELITDAAGGFDHTLRVRIQPVPAIRISVDVVSVHRILGILLENALTHSPTSSPITLGATDDREELFLWVENEGSLPENVDALFEPFQRGEEAGSEGVGLGLYIAARLAASIEGRLEAASEEDAVRFTLRVPLSGEPEVEGSELAPEEESVLAEDV
jgi:K+-sensing histidine kinase KdpD